MADELVHPQARFEPHPIVDLAELRQEVPQAGIFDVAEEHTVIVCAEARVTPVRAARMWANFILEGRRERWVNLKLGWI